MIDPLVQPPNNGSNSSQPPAITSENSPTRAPDGKLLPGGPSLNPTGRPKGISITDAIKKKLEEKYPIDPCFCSCHKPGATDEEDEPTTPNSQSESCEGCERRHMEIEAEKKEQKTYLQKVIESIFDNGIRKGDSRTLKDIWSYIDGLPKGSFDLGVDREGLAELTQFMRDLANPKKE